MNKVDNKVSVMLEKNRWSMHLTVFVSAILIVSLFLLLLPKSWRVNESSDFSSFYEPVARNILLGKGYVLEANSVATFYPPGYPLILAMLFGMSAMIGISESMVLTVFAVAISAVSTMLVFHIARKFTSDKAALFTAILWMTYPFFLWINKQPNSEIPFMVLLFGSCALFFPASCFQKTNKIIYLLSGILLGVAILIRPIAVFFPLVLVISMLISFADSKCPKKFLLITFLLVGVLIPVLPWELYVFGNTGKIVLISGNSSIAMRGGLVLATEESEYKQPVSVPQDVRLLMDDITTHYEELGTTNKLLVYLQEKILESPFTVLKLFGIKALRSWYATDRQSYENYIILLQMPYLSLIAFSSLIAWKRGGASRSLMIGVCLLTLCNWGMDILVTSTLRYMVPVIGLQFVLIAQIPFKFIKKSKQIDAAFSGTH